jgi:thiol-disulfide isomerase/thioredoxin
MRLLIAGILMQELTPGPQKQRRNRLLTLGIGGAATALVVALVVFNLRPATVAATECPVQAEAAAAIDAVAVGQLAALSGTGKGRSYANLAFNDAAGDPTSIAAFQGKKLLVNFWASWCGPCREEMPELDALAAKYNSDEFMVLPVNLDAGANGLDKAEAFLAEEGNNWPNLPLYADPSFRAFDRLKADAVALGLPATLLLDENGCELAVLPGPAAWNSQDGYNVIEALLGA